MSAAPRVDSGRSTRVAFLGLGAIGAPMAGHLADRQFDLVVWNRTPGKAEAFASRYGVRAVADPADAGAHAEVLVTCLPSSREVNEVLQNGLAAAMSHGSILLDCTSGDPAETRRISTELRGRGISVVDAPVSGGTVGAEAGTLTVMGGGPRESFERVRPILQAFAKRIVYCGDTGSGHAVKAVSNALLAAHIWTTAEAMLSLKRAGIDVHAALEAINGSAGRSNVSENLFPQRVLTRAFPRTFRLALLNKDVRIAIGLGESVESTSPMLELAARLTAEAHAQLGNEVDHVEAVQIAEKRAGIQIA